MATNHGSIEFLKFPNPQFPGDRTKLIKKWIRDSWARRKIAALQQAVAAIVVPTKTSDLTNDSGFITAASVPSASAANPAMDGTASAGTSTAWARGDHVHPHDTTKQDTLTAAQLAAVNSGITADTLFPTTQKTLTPYSGRCTIEAGGYVKIGAIVFLDVTIATTYAAGSSSAVIFTAENADLETLSQAFTALTVYNSTAKGTATKGIVDPTGRIQLTNCQASQTLRVSGCYISKA